MLNKMDKYLIFERLQFKIDEKMLFSLSIRVINDDKKSFYSFLNQLISQSYKLNSFINVYKIENDNGSFWLNKIAWIKQGQLFTL